MLAGLPKPISNELALQNKKGLKKDYLQAFFYKVLI